MEPRHLSRCGFAAGSLLAFLVIAAIGAGYAAAPATPKYSVQYAGQILCITNNETDQLFIYENTDKGSELKSVLELGDTGKKTIRGKLMESGKNENVQSDLKPDEQYRVMAELEGEVSKVTMDSVSLRVMATEDVEQGVPAWNRSPYTNRVFKNAGVSARNKKVVITIPKDRIRAATAIQDERTVEQ